MSSYHPALVESVKKIKNKKKTAHLKLLKAITAFTASYQTQGKVEQSRAAVEQDGDKRGRGGKEEAHVPAHYHP